MQVPSSEQVEHGSTQSLQVPLGPRVKLVSQVVQLLASGQIEQLEGHESQELPLRK